MSHIICFKSHFHWHVWYHYKSCKHRISNFHCFKSYSHWLVSFFTQKLQNMWHNLNIWYHFKSCKHIITNHHCFSSRQNTQIFIFTHKNAKTYVHIQIKIITTKKNYCCWDSKQDKKAPSQRDRISYIFSFEYGILSLNSYN